MDGPDSWKDVATGAPAMDDPRALRPTEYTDEKTSAAALSRVENLRVLVVDGNPDRLEALCRSLRRQGLDAHGGDVEREGYRRAVALRPDVVLSDLTTPGEPGWWLFQRFRRQPLLRWTPVLLLRWWEQSGEDRVRLLTAKVVERLAEALAPVRVLEERVTAGRFAGDRVETTGVPVLLGLIATRGLDGCFSVNDSWNIFECRFQAGRPLSTIRRGVDGGTDAGEAAFLQLVLCEAGRWSFRSAPDEPAAPDLSGTFGECMDRAAATIAELFGPDARMDQHSAPLLDVRLPVVREVAAAVGGTGRRLIEALAAGASPAELETLVLSGNDIVTAERALFALLRNGAVVLRQGPAAKEREPEQGRVARAAATLLGIVAADHRTPAALPAGGGDAPAGEGLRQETGYYRVSRVQAEKVAARAREGLIVPGARASVSDDLALGEREPGEEPPADRPTPAVTPTAVAREVFLAEPAEPRRASYPFVLPRESLAPPPEQEGQRGPSQMWIAILLAVALGGLVLAGVWLVAGDPHPEPPVTQPSAR
jgi:CheY-like chemotaxis protein